MLNKNKFSDVVYMDNVLYYVQVHTVMRGLYLLRVVGKMIHPNGLMNSVENETFVDKILQKENVEILENGDALGTNLTIKKVRAYACVFEINFQHKVGFLANTDDELLKRTNDATAIQVRSKMLTCVFAFCSTICRYPWWGMVYKSYCDDLLILQRITDIILVLQGKLLIGSRKGVFEGSMRWFMFFREVVNRSSSSYNWYKVGRSYIFNGAA